MAKKLLYCATVDYHFKAFHLPYLKWFKEQGWEVHVAAHGEMELPYVDQKFNLPIQRSPFNRKNLLAFKELKAVIDQNEYEIIHCHTPMGGVLARLAARNARRKGTKVIYTAHGFHFCKGAPLVNWIIYYPIEKFLAQHTDCLITINQEDYELATKKLKVPHIEHVHGVGVNTDKFKPLTEKEKPLLKKSFGYKPDDFLLFYAAEFNKNKNQQFLIRAIALIKEEVPQAKLLLAGEGVLQQQCKDLAKELGVLQMVQFLGYRNDIEEILPMCDVAVASSLREGLPVNIMESMACGLPVVAVDNRGHRELVNNLNGFIILPENLNEFANKLLLLAHDSKVTQSLGSSGRSTVQKSYSISKVLDEKVGIYQTYMNEMEGVRWAVH
ncbi:glycosyltransferase family 4 protein [Bacillus sp. AK128]